MAMGMPKLRAFILVLALIFAISSLITTALAAGQHQHHTSRYGPDSLKSYQCPSECERRCSKTHHKKPCLFFCNKCCNKCLCVPPGFYGNKEVCPCYNNWKTQSGGPKCP